MRSAQDEYLKQRIKCENELDVDAASMNEMTEQPKFVEVITNCDEFNAFADEYAAKSMNQLDTDDDAIQTNANQFDDALCNDSVIEKIEAAEIDENENYESGRTFEFLLNEIIKVIEMIANFRFRKWCGTNQSGIHWSEC